MFSTRSLNLVILMLLIVCLIFVDCFTGPIENRAKKWYSWNNDIEVSKKWYDWQNVPHALQQKRQFEIDNYGVGFGKS